MEMNVTYKTSSYEVIFRNFSASTAQFRVTSDTDDILTVSSGKISKLTHRVADYFWSLWTLLISKLISVRRYS